METTSRIEQLCIESGLKMTRPRQAIARVLSDSFDHPTAEEVHRRALAINPRVSLTTVYRTLSVLQEKGILARRAGAGRALYEAPKWLHCHVVDMATGNAVLFEDEAIQGLAKEVATRLGFEFVGARLAVYGRKAGRS